MAESATDYERTRLWAVLDRDAGLSNVIRSVRDIAGALGREAGRVVPDYTDHSLRHMDSLWGVADQVLTPDETQELTTAEAFVLAASFYVHDLGMAIAATHEGLTHLEQTSSFRTAMSRLSQIAGIPKERVRVLAVQLASREEHARVAGVFATRQMPGLGRFLIEDTNCREAFGEHIGMVAASHHWTIAQLHQRLGIRGAVPTTGHGTIDLGFIGCLLRIIDFAHINRDRAAHLDRALRSSISSDSIIHWNAQAQITGPCRQDHWLVYGSTAPIEEVDAWWLFYDLAKGLDAEVRSVRDYLDERAISKNRLSLKGVRGVTSPDIFANLVQLAGAVAPIDVRIQPHSMERLVELLGGPAVYGPDQLAPLRELLQNARDAISLRKLTDEGISGDWTGHIEVEVKHVERERWLHVKDDGVGMSRAVITRYLLGIASDYWHSAEFHRDYSDALGRGFAPIGRFGIGFLSTFMLGDRVVVQTETPTSRFELTLRGVGRRGELVEQSPTGRRGTTVKVRLNENSIERLKSLPGVLRARCPMLGIPIIARWSEDFISREAIIEPGWWHHISTADLEAFVQNWRSIAWTGSSERQTEDPFFRIRVGQPPLEGVDNWPGPSPAVNSDWAHVFSTGEERIRAVLRCSSGIAVDLVAVLDACGVCDAGPLELNVARSTTVGSSDSPGAAIGRTRRARQDHDPSIENLQRRLREGLRPEVLAKLNDLERYGMLPARYWFLRRIAEIYDPMVLVETSLRWIPVAEPPGDIIHRSPQSLREKLANVEDFVCGIGTPTRAAFTLLARRHGVDKAARTTVVALGVDEFDVSYSVAQEIEREDGDEPLKGPVPKLLERVSVREDTLVLLSALLEIVGQAWHTSAEALKQQDWELHYKRNILWAFLKRDLGLQKVRSG